MPSLQALARRGALPLNGYSYPATFWHTVPMARQTVTDVLTGIALLGTVVFGQSSTSSKAAAERPASATASADTWSVPRIPDGHPDFQGVWANNGMTPLERPKQFGLRTTMTDAELADLKRRADALIDGGDAFFADELIHRGDRGEDEIQLHRYADRQLRPDLVVGPRVGQPHLAHHRSARRPDSGPAPGAAERARARPRPSRGEDRPITPGPVAGHALHQLWHAEHPRRLSELLRDHPRPGCRRAAQRDDPRRAHLPD